MCGICGSISLNGAPGTSARVLEQMNTAITHRGPDDAGMVTDGRVALAMRRLSIIDLAGGHQPIWNEDDSLCIVFNGELYNFLDLRPQLEATGHQFKTRSDTEVILHAYEEWGADCLRRFNGMFAFAIWDRKKEELFLARDPVGEKPLYFFRDNQRLIFASEIKAILADKTIERKIDARGLTNFLAYGHGVAPQTIYQNISKLLPGYYLRARGGDVETVQYWDVAAQMDAPALESPEEYSSQILELLDDAVKRRMIADVPVGAFLSGGVDSSAIVGLMKRHASGPVKTFSLGFSAGGAYNELSAARVVARHFGTEHHELEPEHTDLVKVLQTLVYHYDEPFGDTAGFPLYLLSKFAREHVKVVLCGDGGDELFGGYRRYAADRFAPMYQKLPRAMGENWIPNAASKLPRGRKLKRTLSTLPIKDPAHRYASWLLMFTPEMQDELVNENLRAQAEGYDPLWPYPLHYNAPGGANADHLNRLMYVDLKTWLADAYMEKTDKATMACSLEGRLPLLDPRLVELAFRIPGKYKIHGSQLKWILKKAVAPLLPPSVLKRPKHGFSVPTDAWFRGDLKDFAFGVLLDDRTKARGYFDMEMVERLWREHVEGRNVRDGQLWLLVNFELWHRQYLDGDAA
jgi:asparagine synthase (glutamine-hydrolysing)